MTAAADQIRQASESPRVGWPAVAYSLTRPYPVTIPMVALVALVPLYLAIANVARANTPSAPAFALDTALPLQPVWAIAYGALYGFLIVLPVLLVRQQDHIRRTVYAYLTVWIVSYIVFLMYPTVAPRPATVDGAGFATWSLRVLYGADPPYNCFPSIHVAHSFVSALTITRVHRRLGLTALACAALVALSTLFTKQHYVADVIAGTLLALAAYIVFLKRFPREQIPELERRLAPLFALATLALVALAVVSFWVFYKIQTG